VGVSAAPFLNGVSDSIYDENYIMVWELFNRVGVRNGDFKMIKVPEKFGTGDWELFNLASDPGETTDIRDQHPDQLQKMIKAWDDYVVENGVVLGE
jgi:arylsulfatase A-like enzyme